MAQEEKQFRTAQAAHIGRFDHELMAEVHYEQMESMANRIKGGAVGALLYSVVMAVYLHESVGIYVWYWLAAKTLAAAWRLALVFRWKDCKARQPVLDRWFFWIRVTLFLDGVLLGAIGLLALQSNAPQEALLWTAAGLCGVSAVAMSTLESDWVSSVLYSTPIIGQTILYLLIQQSFFGNSTAIAIAIYGAVLLLNARRAARDERQRIVQSRTILRYKKQNEIALEMARTESRIRVEMMSSITHELRTPIHGILAMSNQIARDPSANSTAKAAEMIIKSGEHLVSLVNDMLDFGRLEAAGVTLRPEVFDLNDVIEEVSNIGFLIGQEKGVKFAAWNVLPMPYHVHADPGRIKQISLNLISNGIKFTDKGGEVVLRVRDADGNGNIILDVADNGPGIAEENLTTIFEPFSRHAQEKVGGGLGSTGLGLSISKRLATAMKGTLEVSSELGKGSTFTLKVNLAKVVVSLQNRQPKQEFNLPATLEGHALIAEDDNLTAELARSTLEMCGLRVSVVGRGDLAVQAAMNDSQRPNILLMDGDMPGLDGLAATRKIREYEAQTASPRLPIVIVTGRCMPEDVINARQAGADAHLGKPYSNNDLIRTVAQRLAPMQNHKRGKIN
ncbi:ATP-binding response regulator [Azohydromonas lata]|uniref:ATP-binding response regulator n=1 Tax=Azohydromonas lata TaxID=45677 RepID=UPI000A04F9B7|nr:ATP-binding protein [Azohydromonas lata]